MNYDLPIQELKVGLSRQPRDRKSLHAWIKTHLGFHIPRKATCPDHQAPFDFIADSYFGDVTRVLILGSRGSGKTLILAISTLLKSKFVPGTTTAYYAAVDAQGKFGFGYLKSMLEPFREEIDRDTVHMVRWKNKSWCRPGSGHTATGITAFRCNRLVVDEVDLWQPEMYETANLMVTATHVHGSERLVASTAYTSFGLMQVLLAQAKKRKMETYRWCVVPETLVWTKEGEKRIDSLVPGDEVWAYGPDGFTIRQVTNCALTKKQAQIIELSLSNGRTLRLTPDHPVLTSNGWVDAGELKVGQFLVGQTDCTSSRSCLVIVFGIEPGGESDVWDCEVEHDHTFVAEGISLHNCVFETMERCAFCREEKCPLFIWENPRTGEQEPLCGGRGLKADGFLPYEFVIDEYLSTDSETYMVQKLLENPERKALIYPRFDLSKHSSKPPKNVRKYGKFGVGVDWGFDHPMALTVFAQMPNGKYFGIEEVGERFATPARELELCVGMAEKYGKTIPFYCGKDQPKSIAMLHEHGLTVVPNLVDRRDDGHQLVRRLIDPNKGPLMHLDEDKMPLTAFQLSTLHRDEKGREVLKDNDFADSSRYILASAVESGGLQAGGGYVY